MVLSFNDFHLYAYHIYRYLKQLTESLSLETRQPVKISRVMAGQPPQLIQNPAYQSHQQQGSRGSTQQQQGQQGCTAGAGGGGDAGASVSAQGARTTGGGGSLDASNLQQNNNSNNQIGAGVSECNEKFYVIVLVLCSYSDHCFDQQLLIFIRILLL